ncbi:hypothetical protein D5S18_08750 [Nocardia panacis]|uniref:Uncharacterized protein n=1 Tax=Nocardia panacis TaxID=2340916 RepID=A0A3A4L223_9NOCA|nr:hypothetical protein D5S18_08750 [Nocardia panacis]
MLRDIQEQLHGPGLRGWPQLGTDADGHHRTLVDGLALALDRIDRLTEESAALRDQVVELRREIGDLEMTTADLDAEVQRLSGRALPWPLSLLAGPAALVGEQLARLEAVLADLSNSAGPPRGSGNGTAAPLPRARS